MRVLVSILTVPAGLLTIASDVAHSYHGALTAHSSLTFRNSAIADSDGDGIYVDRVPVPDPGTSSDWGYNSIRDNAGYQLGHVNTSIM